MIGLKDRFLLIIDVLRASFISLVPYYILYSSILLIIELFKYYELFPSSFILEDSYNLIKLITSLLPLLINISISYHLTSLYYTSINRFSTIILSLLVYLSVELISYGIDFEKYVFPHSMILAIIVPLITTFFISKSIYFLKMYQDKLNNALSNNISTMIIYIIPFTLIYFILTFILSVISINLHLGNTISIVANNQETLLLFLRTVFSNFLWFFGIHGINFFDTVVNITILDNLLFPNLTYKEFFNLFITLGGSGAGLSLVIAIFLVSKDKHTSFIGKMALPFVIFNINEILIFGIPIFMNFSLIVPFILVPIINFFISYLFLAYTDMILFNDIFIPWTTPALINIYLSTDGNLIAVLLQFFIIITGTLIYIPFIKKYSRSQSSTLSLEKIARKFEVSLTLESKRDIKFQEAQALLINSHYKVNKIIDRINQDNLIIYYQPKVNIKKNICNSFEALLRIKEKNGLIKEPDFMIEIEDSGLASILDLWVAKEVRKNLDLWSEKDFYPEISINIFPHTLEDNDYVQELINILKGYNVGVEIIERRSSLSQKVFDNINLLKKNNIKILIDDLGVGYTNFSMLYEIPLDSVKIDRKIIQFTKDEKGLILYENICKLCTSLNFQIILEGIETQEEYDMLVNENIDIIQGWYYSKAIPFSDVEKYSRNFS